MNLKNEIYEALYQKYVGTRFDSTRDFSTYRDEILLIYKNVLDETIPKYPRLFFHGEDGLINAYLILSYVFLK